MDQIRKPRSLPLAVLTRRKPHTSENRCKIVCRQTPGNKETSFKPHGIDACRDWAITAQNEKARSNFRAGFFIFRLQTSI